MLKVKRGISEKYWRETICHDKQQGSTQTSEGGGGGYLTKTLTENSFEGGTLAPDILNMWGVEGDCLGQGLCFPG